MAFRQSENISKFLSVFLLFVWAILSLAYILRLQAPISIINSFILLWSTVIVLYFLSHQDDVLTVAESVGNKNELNRKLYLNGKMVGRRNRGSAMTRV